MAQNLKMLYLYDVTSLSDSDLALEFSRWATDDKAKAASASLGECEIFPYLDGSMTVDDMTFLEAEAQGQTFFASAGDTGSFCPVSVVGENGVPAGAPLVNYPAASPYVVGVGGTSLLTNADGSYNSEISWYAGGGGLSQFESAPYWQQDASTLLSETSDRGVPDVAMDADPNSGAEVFVAGVAEEVGGTSLSSPLALGVWAHAISVNPKLGVAGPQLYSLYDGAGLIGSLTGAYPEGGYHDIVVGANGLYTALPGYDLTTGLGTFVAGQFVTDLAQ
jgi:subtilase family serine protease